METADADRLLEEVSWIRRLALQLVRDAAEADDLVQQTLLTALQQRGARPRELRPWLAAITRRQLAFARRGAMRRAAREAESARREALPSPDELAARAEVQRSLVEAVLGLTEPYRSAVLLRYFEGVEPAEIARRRGLPAGTVRSQLSRGLGELRAALDRRHGGDSRAWYLALLPIAVEPPSAPTSPLTPTTVALGGLALKHLALLVAGSATLAAALVYALRGDPAVPPPARTAAAASRAELVEPVEDPLAAVALPEGDLRRAPTATAAPEPGGAAEVAPARAPLRGRVVDARTGTPLEQYLVELSSPEKADETARDSGITSVLVREPGGELLITDAEGRFESALERQPGPVRVLLRDAPGSSIVRFGGGSTMLSPPAERELEWDGESEIALAASCGPTYRVRFAPPPGLTQADFNAILFEGDTAHQTYGSLDFSMRGQLRGRDPCLARFPAGKFQREELTSWTLRVESRDGLWAGDAAVPACADDCADETWIELLPAACLAVELAAAPGLELSEPSLTLHELDTDRYEIRQTWDLELGGGRVAFGGLPGGRYRLSVRAQGMQTVELDLELVPGQSLSERVELVPLPAPAHVRGELRSRSGRFQGSVNLIAWSEVDHQRRHALPPWIERDGQLVAPFEFTGFPAGEVRLTLISFGVPLRWHPEPASVQAPVEGLVFECDDLGPPRRVLLRVVDALDGSRVEGYDAELLVDGSPPALERVPPGDQAFWIELDAELDWSVTAPGYEPEEGDTNRLQSEGEDVVLAVRLTRTP